MTVVQTGDMVAAVNLRGAASILIIGLCVAAQPAAANNARTSSSFTISGSVSCAVHLVEGVWVEAGSSGGWATLSKPANSSSATNYSVTLSMALPVNIRLHVGCGGKPSAWWSDNRTPSSSRTIGVISGSRSGVNAVCNDGAVGNWPGGQPPASDNTRCSWGAYPYTNAICYSTRAVSGKCAGYRWGYARTSGWVDYDNAFSPKWGFQYRNCTDYVMFWEYMQNVAAQPVFTGNAVSWKSEATGRNGWAVAKKPSIGDIAWYNGTKTVPEGHVGVVTTVFSDGLVAVEDFNALGTGADGISVHVSADAYLHRT